MASGRVLLTGAAGFIGRATLARLRRQNIDCILTDVRAHREIPELEIGDLLDSRFLGELIDRSITTVIHLGAILPTVARRDPIFATKVNVDASCMLLNLARTAGVRRFVFGSSLGVYGGRFDRTPVSEETPAAPEEIYGAGKLYTEHVGSLMDRDEFAFSALRIATTIGEGVTNSASPWRSQVIETLRSALPVITEIPYVKDAVLPMVHVSDVARALVQMATGNTVAHGVFNSPAESMSVAELCNVLSDLNPKAKVTAGTRRETGIPAFIDCSKLVHEIALETVPLRQHFQEAANQRHTPGVSG